MVPTWNAFALIASFNLAFAGGIDSLTYAVQRQYVIRGRWVRSNMALGSYQLRSEARAAADRQVSIAGGVEEIFFEEHEGESRRPQIAGPLALLMTHASSGAEMPTVPCPKSASR